MTTMTRKQIAAFWRKKAIEDSKPPVAHFCFVDPDRNRLEANDNCIFQAKYRHLAFKHGEEMTKKYGGFYLVLPQGARLPVQSMDSLFEELTYHRDEYPEKDSLRTDDDEPVDDETLKSILPAMRVGGKMGCHYPKAKGVPTWHDEEKIEAVERELLEYAFYEMARVIINPNWKGSGSTFGVKDWGDHLNRY